MLSLCMIVRNEEANLPRLLGSVRGLVDEMVIVDTGSTDRTIEAARSWGARVERIEWQDDFAAARNHSLSQARGDWILVLDADNEFERDDIPVARQRLEATEALALCVRERVICPGVPDSVKDQAAFFRNRPEHRYQFRIHEQVSVDPARTEFTSIRVVHHGYTVEAAMPAKKARNLRILKRMKGDPDPLAQTVASYYLGMYYENDAQPDEAAREFAAAAYSGLACNFRLWGVFGLARVSTARGEFEFAAKLYATLLQANPGAVEAELGFADLLWRQGKREEARTHFRKATASTLRMFPYPPEPWFSSVRRRLDVALGSPVPSPWS